MELIVQSSNYSESLTGFRSLGFDFRFACIKINAIFAVIDFRFTITITICYNKTTYYN